MDVDRDLACKWNDVVGGEASSLGTGFRQLEAILKAWGGSSRRNAPLQVSKRNVTGSGRSLGLWSSGREDALETM